MNLVVLLQKGTEPNVVSDIGRQKVLVKGYGGGSTCAEFRADVVRDDELFEAHGHKPVLVAIDGPDFNARLAGLRALLPLMACGSVDVTTFGAQERPQRTAIVRVCDAVEWASDNVGVHDAARFSFGESALVLVGQHVASRLSVRAAALGSARRSGPLACAAGTKFVHAIHLFTDSAADAWTALAEATGWGAPADPVALSGLLSPPRTDEAGMSTMLLTARVRARLDQLQRERCSTDAAEERRACAEQRLAEAEQRVRDYEARLAHTEGRLALSDEKLRATEAQLLSMQMWGREAVAKARNECAAAEERASIAKFRIAEENARAETLAHSLRALQRELQAQKARPLESIVRPLRPLAPVAPAAEPTIRSPITPEHPLMLSSIKFTPANENGVQAVRQRRPRRSSIAAVQTDAAQAEPVRDHRRRSSISSISSPHLSAFRRFKVTDNSHR